MKQLIVLLVVSLLGAGCATNREYPPIEPYWSGEDKSVYTLGVGDSISINVWRNGDLSVSVPIRPDGFISVPLVGDVQAAGVTSEELAKNLTEQLSNYIRTPQVTVIVSNAASSEYLNRVRVTGAVASPTSMSHLQGMTVMDLVIQAGGLTAFANANETKLYRTTKDGVKSFPVYLDDILDDGDMRTNYLLAPSDTITVPESSF